MGEQAFIDQCYRILRIYGYWLADRKWVKSYDFPSFLVISFYVLQSVKYREGFSSYCSPSSCSISGQKSARQCLVRSLLHQWTICLCKSNLQWQNYLNAFNFRCELHSFEEWKALRVSCLPLHQVSSWRIVPLDDSGLLLRSRIWNLLFTYESSSCSEMRLHLLAFLPRNYHMISSYDTSSNA